MICNIDYLEALEYHKKSNNDITVIYKNIDNANKDFKGCLNLNLDENDSVINITISTFILIMVLCILCTKYAKSSRFST